MSTGKQTPAPAATWRNENATSHECRAQAPAGVWVDVRTASAAELWAFKRERQRRDLAAIRHDRRTNQDMSWFNPEMARNAVVIGDPF